jgi:D-glycero-alpha-D-manno-heptose-7-phosphate kinase
MIVSSAPLRVSFFGGGSDIPQFYMNSPGMVISTAIDRRIKIAVNSCETDHVRAVYSEMEVTKDSSELKHDRIRHALDTFKIRRKIEICSFSDVPTKGTGLGSSSTFTVALVNALYKLKCLPYNKRDLAELACAIEIDLCGEPIGMQDQYAAAYGGFNCIRFDTSGVEVTPIPLSSAILGMLNERLICYSTGVNRKTSDILGEQVANLQTNSTVDATKELVQIAEEGLKLLKAEKLHDFGALLHSTWEQKKKLASSISNPHIDAMYEEGRKAGAIGGKLLGAGGGGYMLFYVPHERHIDFKAHMRKHYRQFHILFTDIGSEAFKL